ncbi:S8 family serine peptidase [Isachenkonia alkalipeptolytica]|uniref:Peptidase S8/S53 domain-containing protein n=1 Tax=Isachenkonia alkalipeptolytica TaxID=2565777 RepID=A0AA44BF72_9CLOT|nr:S8 family serine peptidase [Isachenkonia alkalipeptolytica]NBG88875.1 hypothetical protein [Isachenkonia alkalipeptolytica]
MKVIPRLIHIVALFFLFSIFFAVTSLSLGVEKELEEKASILVQFEASKDLTKIKEFPPSLEHSSVQELGSNTVLINYDNQQQKVALVKELEKMESVLYIEEDKVLNQQIIKETQRSTTPNDSFFHKQWGLDKVKAIEGWQKLSTMNKSAVVAVIDSGVDRWHPDLKNRVLFNGYNFYSDNNDFRDHIGHGTAVAGIIAAETDNYMGIAGVSGAYDINILPLRTSSETGQSRLSDFVKAMNYAIEQEVDVINISMGSKGYSSIENGAIQRAIDSGIVVVASAGNSGDGQFFYPASYSNVISVGSINENRLRSRFSNYNSGITVMAPGESIYSTTLGGTYGYYEGTSFSAPFVSGVAALIKAKDPGMTPDEVKTLLISTSMDLGTPGFNSFYGYGLINMEKTFGELKVEEKKDPELEDGKKIDKIVRFGGYNRYHTAGLIAKEYFGEGVDRVILARGDTINGEPQITNALIASSITGVLDVPILLTRPDVMPEDTLNAINEMNPQEVLILGDYTEVSMNIEKVLQEKYAIKRINEHSSDRVAKVIALMHSKRHNKAFIVGEDALADALSISTVASNTGIPILLAQKNRIPEATKAVIEKSAIEELYIIGGDTVISESTEKELNQLVKGGVTRIWGLNRFETSASVAKYFWEESENPVIANGVTMVDAVSASIIQSPVILVRSNRFVGSTKDYLQDFRNLIVIGGDAVVEEELLNELH